jgi:hypothetical protein
VVDLFACGKGSVALSKGSGAEDDPVLLNVVYLEIKKLP